MEQLEDKLTETSAGKRLSMFQALRHRNYRLYFGGQAVSLIGTWMQSVAQGWLVLRLTDSPFYLGLVSVAASVPVFLFSLHAGVVADRFSKSKLLIFTQTVSMLLAFILAFLTYTGMVQVWHILVLAFLLGASNSLDGPTRQAFVIEMVGREDLLNAIALNSMMFNLARTVGPAVAGVVVAEVGEAAAFLGNGLSFLAVIVSLFVIHLSLTHSVKPRTETAGEIREGLAFIWAEPRIRLLLSIASSLCFFGFSFVALLPVYARDVFHSGPKGFGILSSASGIGALLGALLLARTGHYINRGKMLSAAALIYPIAIMILSYSTWFDFGILLMGIAGACGIVTLALINTTIQTLAPDNLRGRVMSAYTLVLLGMAPIGSLFIGSVADRLGNVPLIVFAGAFLGEAICGVLIWRSWALILDLGAHNVSSSQVVV